MPAGHRMNRTLHRNPRGMASCPSPSRQYWLDCCYSQPYQTMAQGRGWRGICWWVGVAFLLLACSLLRGSRSRPLKQCLYDSPLRCGGCKKLGDSQWFLNDGKISSENKLKRAMNLSCFWRPSSTLHQETALQPCFQTRMGTLP